MNYASWIKMSYTALKKTLKQVARDRDTSLQARDNQDCYETGKPGSL